MRQIKDTMAEAKTLFSLTVRHMQAMSDLRDAVRQRERQLFAELHAWNSAEKNRLAKKRASIAEQMARKDVA